MCANAYSYSYTHHYPNTNCHANTKHYSDPNLDSIV